MSSNTKNQDITLLNQIYEDPDTQLALDLSRRFNTRTLDEVGFKEFLDSLPASAASERAKLEKLIHDNNAHVDADLSTRAGQLVWAAGLGFLYQNSPPNTIRAHSIWRILTGNADVSASLGTAARYIDLSITNRNATMDWATPGSWFWFSPENNHINIDLFNTLLTGFAQSPAPGIKGLAHTTGVMLHEVGHSQLTTRFTDGMLALQEREKALHTESKQRKLTEAEFKELVRNQTEFRLRMDLLNAAEDNCVNQFAVNRSRDFPHDFRTSLNITNVVLQGTGAYLKATQDGQKEEDLTDIADPKQQEIAEAQEKLAKLNKILALAFYTTNGLFERDDRATWQQVGIDPEKFITADMETPVTTANQFLGVQSDFDRLLDLAVGRNGISRLQPTERDSWLLQNIFAKGVNDYADQRCQIMDDIWDKYAAPHAKVLIDAAEQRAENQLNQKKQEQSKQQNQDSGQSPQTNQSQSGQGKSSGNSTSKENQDDPSPSQGSGQEMFESQPEEQTDQQSPQYKPEEQTDQQPYQNQPEEQTDQQPSQNQPEEQTDQQPPQNQPEEQTDQQPSQNQPEEQTDQQPPQNQPEEQTDQQPSQNKPEEQPDQQSSQNKPEEQTDQQSSEGEGQSQPGQGNSSDSGASSDDPSQDGTSTHTGAPSAVDVEGVGKMDMPDKPLPATPEEARKAGRNGEEENLKPADAKTVRDLAREAKQRARNANPHSAGDTAQPSAPDEDLIINAGDKGGRQKGIDLASLAKGNWSDFRKRVNELEPVIARIAEDFKYIREKQKHPVRTVARQKEELPRGGDIVGRLDMRSQMNLAMKRATRQQPELQDRQKWKVDEIRAEATSVELWILGDGSGSMSYDLPGGGRRIDSAVQSMAILYEAGRRANFDTFVGMWGDDSIRLLAKPGDNEQTIGQNFQTVRNGINSGTQLSPSFTQAIERSAKQENNAEGRPKKFAGMTHFLIISDGELNSGDIEPTAKVIKQLFRYGPAVSVDIAILGGSGAEMQQVVDIVKKANPAAAIDILRADDAKEIPKQLAAKVKKRFERSAADILAIPDAIKREGFTNAHRAIMRLK